MGNLNTGDDIAVALIKACGHDPSKIRAVRFSYEVGSLATIEFEQYVHDDDTAEAVKNIEGIDLVIHEVPLVSG